MMRRNATMVRRGGLSFIVGGYLAILACSTPSDQPDEEALPDVAVRVHKAMPATPTPATLAYVEAIADVHGRADAALASGVASSELVAILREGVEIAVPEPLRAGDSRLESDIGVVRLELIARYCEQLMSQPEGAVAVQRELESILAPRHSLPLDRATARALVVLGDAAFENGDDALAVGSYSRAIRVMTMLQQELVR